MIAEIAEKYQKNITVFVFFVVVLFYAGRRRTVILLHEITKTHDFVQVFEGPDDEARYIAAFGPCAASRRHGTCAAAGAAQRDIDNGNPSQSFGKNWILLAQRTRLSLWF